MLFKQKTIPIEVNFLLWGKFHFEFNQFDFFLKFHSKNFDGGAGGGQKEPQILILEPFIHELDFFQFSVLNR